MRRVWEFHVSTSSRRSGAGRERDRTGTSGTPRCREGEEKLHKDGEGRPLQRAAMKHPSSDEIEGVKLEVEDRYRVLGALGHGSFGIAVAASEHPTGRKLAIKRIRPLPDSRSRARHILREITTMKLLRHYPNIINLGDLRVSTTSGTLYIVIELMECDLQRILASGQVLTVEHVKVILKQLLLGVQAMHHHGILHCDMKPANILLLSDCQVRITDFGLSRSTKHPPFKDGDVGTRWYRAPEVMLGSEGGCAEPVDVWSVGCIFGEMLGSRGPLFPGKNDTDQISLTLAAVGIPDTESNTCLGYSLNEDALQLLRTVHLPKGRSLRSLVPPDVGEEAFDLLKKLLDMNTQLRLTVAEALGHAFLEDFARLLGATVSSKHASAVEKSIGNLGESAVDFSFEDGDLTAEELGKLIVAEAAAYQDTRPELCRRDCTRNGDDAPAGRPTLEPTLTLKDVLGAVRTQARNRELDAGIGARVGETATGDGDDANTNLLEPTSPPQTFDSRFSSMANLADAENGGLDGLDGSPAGSTDSDRGVTPEPLENRADIRGCEESGGSERPHQRDGGGTIAAGVPEYYRTNTGDGKARSPTGGCGKTETAPRQNTTKQRKKKVSSSKQLLHVEGRGRSFEEERAASLIQRSHRRAAAIRAAQREPLAILRLLRDDPEVQPKPKTDQFRLRATTKSAIEAHIRKTGAARRKPHPLPTGPCWRKAATPMKRVAATRAALTKPRAVSPLHRSVRQVNTFIAATDRQRRQPPSAAARRAHSAPPSRATGRLSVMATSGARVLLRLRKTGAVPRLRPAEATWQHGRRSASGVTTTARQSSSSSSHAGHFLRSAPAAAPWRRARATGIGMQLPRQTARALTSGVDFTVVNMPALSPTMESGTVTEWHKSPGDELSAGDVICDVETDKATVAFDVQDDGVLARIISEAGSGEVSVGSPVAVIVEDADAYAAFVKADAAGESKGIDASSLEGTGKGGRITKADLVLALAKGVEFPAAAKAASSQAPAPATAAAAAQPAAAAAAAAPPVVPSSSSGDFVDEPANNIKKITAKRLTQSKAEVPHLYVSMACEVDGLMAFRKALQKEHDVKVSVNDIIIRSAALALRDVPEANAKWSGGARQSGESIDISVAVATPTGLITPIVTDADQRGLSNISGKVRDLATRARDRQLKPEEFQGGSFTVSNLGMFGINEFSAVINMPQACILAVGGGAPKVKPGREAGDKPRVCSEVTVRLSADRRVVDEAIAAQLLQSFKHYMETPELLLM
ncbi:Dihydrolipoamide S-acetyltransferase [Ectocarpus siliculosus]|uniref:Dihydrolipoamide S-acetyltransferase n=1 Tax=Ectocarpus siliculosus TaxID=2880 RepID=D7FM36_ECTSI|nr:Dihydrolipoamide S-acetyltransferase [Ectocarpus siliculosus]|eukprot:CBJ29861.1 Dihydrolipoamide S-acetyltransferase [Ectocarpus siliculosus]